MYQCNCYRERVYTVLNSLNNYKIKREWMGQCISYFHKFHNDHKLWQQYMVQDSMTFQKHKKPMNYKNYIARQGHKNQRP